ncbi:MAG: hypothetical protein D6718_08155 [Acidobacteria bacterium]|nr:MAG: hypothetical protein D6718_08155 [Acidobacteriota bacterium]
MDRQERIAFCRRVMESLSDLVEGEAPPDLCEQVADLLADCQPFHAYKNTLEATIRLLRECGERGPADPGAEDLLERCIERARRRIEGEGHTERG